MGNKPKKTTPTAKMTPAQAKKLAQIRVNNHIQGTMDAADQRDTRMSRDGGTNRRLSQR